MAALKHKAGLEVLVSALDDKDLRFRALSALAELNDASVLPQVHSLFRRWLIPQFERTQAAGVMAQFGNQEGIDYLLKRAGRKWSEDRPMALELLGAVKAHGALPMLKGILQRAEDLCRGAAARGLGRLGTQEALVILKGALSHADDELKIDIAEGLLLVDSPEARDVAKAIVVQSSDARAELDALLQD
jgi:HEAT repeat protein